MSGTVYTPIWEAEGDRKSFLVGTANITLGTVVALDTGNANTVVTATEALHDVAIGVATETRRTYDNIANSTAQVAIVDDYVTVCTEGIMNVTASGNVNIGDLVEAANDGCVAKHTAASGDYAAVLGIALSDAANAATVKVLFKKK